MLKASFRDFIRFQSLVFELTKRDYKQQHKGSYLGVIWNYLQPLLFVAVLYGVFTLGFRSGTDDGDLPFSIYLVSGMVCWLYFSSNLTSITGVIRSYSFLVKKVDFRLEILPVVRLLSSFFPHFVLLLLSIGLAIMQGILPGWHTLQLLYYYFCMVVLLLGLGWFTAATSLFVKDVVSLVGVITQFGFWLTPIFWRIETMPIGIQYILKMNPVYYLVSGYRDSFSGTTLFWERIPEGLIFWLFTLSMLFFGMIVFRKLRPHFAEVL